MTKRFESQLLGGCWRVIDYKRGDISAARYATAQPAWEHAELGNALVDNRDPRPYTPPTHRPKGRPVNPWTPTTLVFVDRKHDLAHASDGYSRYGSYVGSREDSFVDVWKGVGPLEPHSFTALAWRIAADPSYMSPGLVRLRDDVISVEVDAGGGDQLTVTVTVPITHDLLKRRAPHHWRDWQPFHYGWDSRYQQVAQPEPVPGAAPVVALTAQIVHAGPWTGIPTPTQTSGRALVDECLRAVENMAGQINTTMGPLVRQLLEGQR